MLIMSVCLSVVVSQKIESSFSLLISQIANLEHLAKMANRRLVLEKYVSHKNKCQPLCLLLPQTSHICINTK